MRGKSIVKAGSCRQVLVSMVLDVWGGVRRDLSRVFCLALVGRFL